MKRNGILLLALIVLGIFTYKMDEIKRLEIEKEDYQRHQLIDPKMMGRLVSFKTAHASLMFTTEGIFSERNREKMDGLKVQEFFDELQSLKVEKTIEKSEIEKFGAHHFFPNDTQHYFSFTFEGGKIDFILGHKLNFDETFYMKVIPAKGEERYLIVRDTAPREGFYLKEDEYRSALAYLKLKGMMERGDSFFKNMAKK